MKPRRKKEIGGNLDSLLDTMTAVVGILVIMLIVIQLDVDSAVKRIIRQRDEGLPIISASQLKEIQEQLALAQKDQSKAEKDLKDRQAQQVDRNELVNLQQKIAHLKTQLSKENQAKTKRAELDKKLKDLQDQLAKLEKAIQEKQKQVAKLKAMLATVRPPRVGRGGPATIRLPDPKSAPPGARLVRFLCRDNSIYAIDREALIKAVEDGIRRSGAKKNSKGQIDGEKIVQFFSRGAVGTSKWSIRAKISNYRVLFELQRRRNSGDAVQTLGSRLSRYQRLLDEMDPKKQYIEFLVWPDSFEAYLAARQVAVSKDLLAGWKPMTRKEDSIEWFGNYLSFGAENAVKPKPRPPADPNAPKKPTDTLD